MMDMILGFLAIGFGLFILAVISHEDNDANKVMAEKRRKPNTVGEGRVSFWN